MQRVIILRGCMASGKSTIARKLRSFSNKTAWLKVDNFKDFFDHFEKEARPVVHGVANASLNYLLQQGFSVVMEGVFQNPKFIEQAIKVAEKNGVPCKVFELQASLKTLQQRDSQREEIALGTREPLGDEAIEYIYDKLKKNPYPQAIELNNDNLTLEDSIIFIEKHFN